jgi:antitoxin HigA-1
MAKLLEPIHPGEILREEYLIPLEISINRLARDIGVPPGRISEIVNGKRSVTADTALRLARYFGTTAQFWLNLQARFDLETERDRLGARLKSEVEVYAGAS